ncbi:MAG: DUF1810 domain-containing protein [Janthinobacterium lividum]
MQDHFNLARFVTAQAPVLPAVLAELRAGRKTSHWMWFVFPQIAGLGHSAMAREYALSGRDEAAAYLAHPVLGARLHECTALVLAHRGRDVHGIFGSPDDMKFHSSMTLMAEAAPAPSVFSECLEAFFAGQPDRQTIALLNR